MPNPLLQAILRAIRITSLRVSLRELTAWLTVRLEKNAHFSVILTGLRLFYPLEVYIRACAAPNLDLKSGQNPAKFPPPAHAGPP